MIYGTLDRYISKWATAILRPFLPRFPCKQTTVIWADCCYIYSVPWNCGTLFASPVLAALFSYVQLGLSREQNTQILSQINGTRAQFLSRLHPSFSCIVNQAHNFPRFAPADICQSFSNAKSHERVQRQRKFYLFSIYKHKFRWPDFLHKSNSGKAVVVSNLCIRIEKELGKSTSNSSVKNACRTRLYI